jgi:uncharacterized Zn finger protein
MRVYTMDVPSALYLNCERCGERLHRVIKGKFNAKNKAFEGVVKCIDCGMTYHTVLRGEKTKKIRVILSWMDKSQRKEIELNEDEVLQVNEEMFIDEHRGMITAIESRDKRLNEAKVKDIDTIWAKMFDKVQVNISVSKGGKTHPRKIFAVPEEEFHINDFMNIGREKIVIHRIKSKERIVREGMVLAKDVVRIYGKFIR